jgi:hypothetical protein
LLTVRDNLIVGLYDTATGKEAFDIRGHTDNIYDHVASPDKRFLYSGSDGADLPGGNTVRKWDLSTHKEFWVRQIPGVEKLAISSDGKLLAVGTYDRIEILSTDDGAELKAKQWEPTPGYYGFATIFFAPDSRAVYFAGTHAPIHRWDWKEGKLATIFPGIEETSDLCISRDGRFAGADYIGPEPGGTKYVDQVVFYDAAGTKRTLAVSPSESAYFMRIAFSHNCQLMSASTCHGTFLYVWETLTGSLVSKVEQPEDYEYEFGFSPDGRYVLSRNWHEQVRVTSAVDGSLVATLPAPVAPSLDDVLPCSGDGVIELYHPRSVIPTTKPAPPPDDRRMKALWEKLCSENAGEACRAKFELADGGNKTVAFLKDRVKPVAKPDVAHVAKLIEDLDSDKFAVRDASFAELEIYGAAVDKQLKAALGGEFSTQTTTSVHQLLGGAAIGALSATLRQQCRGIGVLEDISTKEARDLVASVAEGVEGARSTIEGRATLRRMDAQADKFGATTRAGGPSAK